MGIDLSGKGTSHLNGQQTHDNVELYIPEDEHEIPKPKEKKPKKVKEQKVTPIKEDLDLAGKIKRRKEIIQNSIKILISVIIFAGVMTGGYMGFQALTNKPIQPEIVRPIVEQPQLPTEQVQEPVTEVVNDQTGSLPDTPLVPIAGALVKFRNDSKIYLVETNGELRVITTSVVFDNGQSISDVSTSRIYVISDVWQSVRQGKEVVGQVDFDPRVLTLSEIRPFL